MSDFTTKKSDFSAALQGTNPDLTKEILAWLAAPAVAPATGGAHPDDDDTIIIHK